MLIAENPIQVGGQGNRGLLSHVYILVEVGWWRLQNGELYTTRGLKNGHTTPPRTSGLAF